MKLLTPQQAQDLITLVQETQIAEFFEQLQKLGIETTEINNFKKEFISGRYTFDFYERLQTYINSIAGTDYERKKPNYDFYHEPTRYNLKKLASQSLDETYRILDQIVDACQDDHELVDSFVMIAGAYNGLKEDINNGVILTENATIGKNKTRMALLDIIKKLPEKAFEQTLFTQESNHTAQAFNDSEFDLFFSFSSKNKIEAEKIVAFLRGNGLRVFFSDDELKKSVGQGFLDKIEEALKNTQHFVLFCTPDAMESKWVRKEYGAFYQSKFIHNEETHRLFILKGEHFLYQLLPLMLNDIQACDSPQEILDRLIIVEDGSEISEKARKIPQTQKEVPTQTSSTFPIRKIIIGTLIALSLYAIYRANSSNGEVADSKETKFENFTFEIGSVVFDMIAVKGGVFEMGDVFEEGEEDESPIHTVEIDSFYLSKYEVTNAQYVQFLNKYGSNKVKDGEFKNQIMIQEHKRGIEKVDTIWKVENGFENLPVTHVTWYGAYEFCRFYGGMLPSEAQWEYAAREGGRKVRFGNGKDILDPKEANFEASDKYKQSYSIRGEYSKQRTSVGSFAPNSLGLYDMTGNVYEWCADGYNSVFYQKNIVKRNPLNHFDSKIHTEVVLRGGSWNESPYYNRVTNRGSYPPNKNYSYYDGFRFACNK